MGDDDAQGGAEGAGVADAEHEAEEVAEAKEGRGAIDLVQEGEEDAAEEALQEAADDEDGLGAKLGGIGSEEGGRQHGGKVADAEHEAVLYHRR